VPNNPELRPSRRYASHDKQVSFPLALRSVHPVPATLALLIFLCATIAFCSAGFLVGIRVARWQVVAALLIAVGASFVGRGSCRQHVRRAAVLLGVIGLGVFASGLSVMYAIPDAEGYHRPAAQLIADGWNPVSTHRRSPCCRW